MAGTPNQSCLPCGTYGGYQQHRRRGQEPCDPCREAARVYQQERRAKDPEKRAEENAKSSARERAVWRLAAEHPERFKELVAEEFRRAGLAKGRTLAS